MVNWLFAIFQFLRLKGVFVAVQTNGTDFESKVVEGSYGNLANSVREELTDFYV